MNNRERSQRLDWVNEELYKLRKGPKSIRSLKEITELVSEKRWLERR